MNNNNLSLIFMQVILILLIIINVCILINKFLIGKCTYDGGQVVLGSSGEYKACIKEVE